MYNGIIFIGVDEGKTSDKKDPYRNGRFCVVKEDAVKRIITDNALLTHIIKERVAFVPEDVWEKIGLP
jgi:hypothetical protein